MGWWPAKVIEQQAPLEAAVTRSGTASASAPWIRSTTRWQVPSRPLTAANLVEVCRDPELGFVLAPQDVGFDPLRHERPDAWKGWNLYDCGRVRLHPAVSP